MSEGRITLSPTVQIQAVPTGGTTQNRSTVPIEIAKLPSGALLKGFVVNRDPQNNPIIRTEKGDVLVRSEIFLKTGSEVALKVEKTIAGVNARLVSVDGQGIKELIQQISQQPTTRGDSVSSSAIQNSSSGSTTVANPTALPVQTAVLVQVAPQSVLSTLPSQLQPLIQNLIEGASLNVRIVQAENPLLKTNNTNQPVQTVAQQQNTLNPAQLSSAYSKYGGYKAPIPPSTPSAPSTTAAPPTTSTPVDSGIAFQIRSIAASGLRLPANNLPAPLTTLFAQQEIAALVTTTRAANTVATPTATSTTTPVASNNVTATTPLAPNSAAPLPAAPTTTNTVPPIAGSSTATTPQAPAATAPTVAPTGTPAQAAPIQTVAPTISGTQVTAQVIGIERGGEAVVQTPIGNLKISTPTPLTVGSTITLDLSASLQPLQTAQGAITAAVSQAAAQAPSDWLALSRDWNALNSIMAILQDVDPANAQQFMQRSFAQSGKDLTKGLLFFLKALRLGDPREWLGNQLMQHRDVRIQELVKKVMSEFSALRPMSADSPDQPWQSAFIPIMQDREPDQLRVFWRDYKEPGSNGEKTGDRFIIEATLSELGELQFDGLVSTKQNPTQFDLAIRTNQPLDETMKKDIHNLFLSAAEVAGFEGQLRFYEKPEHMEHPLEEIVKALQQKVLAEGIDSRSILA